MVRAVEDPFDDRSQQQQGPPSSSLARIGNRRYRGYHHHQLYGSERRSDRPPHPFPSGGGRGGGNGGGGFQHVSGRNLSGDSSSAGSIGGNENNADLAKSAVPAAPVPPTGTATAPPLPFVGHPQLDTNQTFILSGPFPKYDAERGIYVHVFTARPIPTGMTVIATPLRPNTSTASVSNNNVATEINANPPNKIAQEDNTQPPPLQKIGSDDHAAAVAGRISPNGVDIASPASAAPPSPCPPSPPLKEGKPKTPCFMYWSARFPEGRMVPLRQPQPPVYFHTGGDSGIKDHEEVGNF